MIRLTSSLIVKLEPDLGCLGIELRHQRYCLIIVKKYLGIELKLGQDVSRSIQDRIYNKIGLESNQFNFNLMGFLLKKTKNLKKIAKHKRKRVSNAIKRINAL